MATVADKIFLLSTHDLTSGLAWLGIIAYTLQIYFDFSGYSDMAIGLGRMFGFHFLENFNYPYISKSIREFWLRWHISLTNWFRDYLYIPLGGNRCGRLRTYFNLITVFFLCGLWHGASWNFVIWGMLHGWFMIIERAGLVRFLEKIWSPVRHAYVLLVVMAGWVFFRAETLSGAVSYIASMFGFAKGAGTEFNVRLYLDNEKLLVLIAGTLFSAPVFYYLKKRLKIIKEKYKKDFCGISGFANIIFLTLILFACVMRLATGAYNPFIYFRF
jgi:alginate O-acetyltransferase complex protein AlgI